MIAIIRIVLCPAERVGDEGHQTTGLITKQKLASGRIRNGRHLPARLSGNRQLPIITIAPLDQPSIGVKTLDLPLPELENKAFTE